jgi:flagellar assembly protein FliH
MDLCGNILGMIQNLIGNYANDVNIISQKSLAVVLLSLKKLLPELYATHGAEQIESVIQQCLAIAHEMPKIQIRVSPNMQSIIEQRIILIAQQHGFNGKLTVVADATLADSDCRVEWGNGGLENISSQCWQQIESHLLSAIPKSISGNMPHNNSEE